MHPLLAFCSSRVRQNVGQLSVVSHVLANVATLLNQDPRRAALTVPEPPIVGHFAGVTVRDHGHRQLVLRVGETDTRLRAAVPE